MNPTLKPFAEFTAAWEGWSKVAYLDSKGIHSIGYGFNLTRRDAAQRLKLLGLDYIAVMARRQTITREQGLELMEADLAAAYAKATTTFPSFQAKPAIAQWIAVDFFYNLGFAGASKFPGFLTAFRAGDYATAAAELMFTNVGAPGLTGYFQDTKTRAHHHISALLKLHKDRA